jgi:hypothetical protein
MKHISIIIFISLIAFGSFAINTTNTFSDLVEKVSDVLKVSDASETLENEETLPTFLQIKLEAKPNNPNKNLSIKPIGLKSGEVAYKALILMNGGGLELIRIDVEQGKIIMKKFENNSFKTSTQANFDIDFKISKNEKLYLYTLADNGSTHCTAIASDFINKNPYKTEIKEQIAPLRKKSKPGWDKMTNQPISSCFFTKPLNDGKSYAWKGDVKATIQKGTFDDKGYSVSYQIKFDKLPKDNDAFLSFKNEETGQTALRFLFDKGQLLYQNNKGKTFYTNTTIKEKEWVTIGWSYYMSNAYGAKPTSNYYINGIEVTNDNESTLIDWTKNQTLEFKKGAGNWEMNNLIFWSEVKTTELANAPLITPKSTDANIKGLFLFNEGTGQKMLNDKIDGSGITVNGTGDCITNWTVSTYQPTSTLDFNNKVHYSYETNKITKPELKSLKSYTFESWTKGGYSAMFTSGGLQFVLGEVSHYTNSSPKTVLTSTKKGDNNKWVHWAYTYDHNTRKCKIYKNGQLTKSTFDNNRTSFLSDFEEGSVLKCRYVDEVRVWNTVRTEKEIKDNYRYRMESVNCGSNLLINEHFDNQPTKAAILLSDRKDCQGKGFNKIKKQTLVFDGNDDKIIDKVDIANKSFTIEFLAKRKETSKEMYFIRVGDKYESNGILHVGYRTNGKFVFALFGDDLEVDSKYNDDKWHHWACVYDATAKEQKIYQDGVEIGKKTAKKNFIGTSFFQLGKGLDNKDGLEGNLAEFRVWDVARTSAEINTHKSSPLTGICPNLLLYYNFDKVKNNELINQVSNKKANLQNFGTTPFVADFLDFKNTPKDGCTPPPGSVDYTLSLNGQSDHVTTSQDIDLNKKPFTIEFWAKRTLDNKKQIIVSHANNLEVGFDANNKIYSNYSAKYNRSFKLTAKKVSDNKWHHYTYVYDINYNSFFLFIDGEISAKAKFTQEHDKYDQSEKLLLGRSPSGNHPFGGEIDELRVWNKALYPNYIKKNYQAKYPNIEKDLLAYYNFNDGQGTTLTDVKSGNNGTINTVKNVSLAWQKSTKPIKLNPAQPVQNGYYSGYSSKYYNFNKIENEPFTLMLWMKKGRSGELKVHATVPKSSHYTAQLIRFEGDQLICGLDFSTPINANNQWQHYSISIDQSHVKIFINGILVKSGNIANFKYMGGGVGSGYTTSKFHFDKKISIDDLYIFKKVLNENEIKQYMASPPVMNSTFGNANDVLDKIHYYNPFDDGTKGFIQPTFAPKPTNNYALKFDGYNDYVEYNGQLKKKISQTFKNELRTYTFETWINPTTVKESKILSIAKLFDLQLQSNGNLKFQMYYIGHGSDRYVDEHTIPVTISPNKWTHIAFTFSAEKIRSSDYKLEYRFYINGEEKHHYYKQYHYLGNGGYPEDVKMTFGAKHNKSSYFEGSIDEVKIYNKILDKNAIKASMTKQMSGGEQNLIFYSSFDENKGTDILNRTIANKIPIAKYATMHQGKLHNMSSSAWVTGPPIQMIAPMPYIYTPKPTVSGDCALETAYGQHQVTLGKKGKGNKKGTVEFWFFSDDLKGAATILKLPVYSFFTRDYSNDFSGASFLKLEVNEYGELTINGKSTNNRIQRNKWQHIAITYEHDRYDANSYTKNEYIRGRYRDNDYDDYIKYNTKVYLNGSVAFSNKIDAIEMKSYGSFFAEINPEKNLNAMIDDIMHWKTIRTESEIKSDMKSIPYSSDLLHSYNCNDCSGTKLDDGRNNEDATINTSTDNPFGQAGPKQ